MAAVEKDTAVSANGPYSPRTCAILNDSLAYRARMLRQSARLETDPAVRDEMLSLAIKTETILGMDQTETIVTQNDM